MKSGNLGGIGRQPGLCLECRKQFKIVKNNKSIKSKLDLRKTSELF